MSNLVAIGSTRLGSVADRRGRLERALPGLIPTIVAAIGTWAARIRQRRALADLADRNDYLLADIGVTVDQARREAAKPFWVFRAWAPRNASQTRAASFGSSSTTRRRIWRAP